MLTQRTSLTGPFPPPAQGWIGLFLLALLLFLGGCVSTQVRQAETPAGQPIPVTGTVVLVEPDIELYAVGAGGMTEPRKEWTEVARREFPEAARQMLAAQGGIGKANAEGGKKNWSNMASAMTGGILKANAIAAGLTKAYEAAKEFYNFVTTAAPEHANETEESIRALGGVFAMIDSAGHGYDYLNDAAHIYHNQLTDTGIEAGVAASDMRDAFDKIAEHNW